MKIIVAGLPKTGTKSMTAALRKLGYDVYDFVEHMYLLEKEWDEVFRQEWTTEKFRKMYNDVDAAVDMPASYFWEEIHKAFPDAKIILTVRDSEEAWIRSLRNHYHALDSHVLGRIVQILEVILQRKTGLLLTVSYRVILGIDRALWGRKTHLNESLLKMKYRAHNAHVMQAAPPGKLLVFNCKEGWEPLSRFLDVPTPEGAFPHKNVCASVVEETANNHPLVELYKKELAAGVLKLIVKTALSCLALGLVVAFTIGWM